jgi:hypothetical protein
MCQIYSLVEDESKDLMYGKRLEMLPPVHERFDLLLQNSTAPRQPAEAHTLAFPTDLF